jgi:hypothetical protein
MASKIAFLRLAVDLERGNTRRCVLAVAAQGDMPAFFLPATRI